MSCQGGLPPEGPRVVSFVLEIASLAVANAAQDEDGRTDTALRVVLAT